MIPAFLKDEALLANIEAEKKDLNGFHIWWLGQSGFLIQWQGKHLLIDPYLSDSLTKKYADTDKPHVRMSERVIDPGKLNFIDLVSSSHNHTDHLDGETLIPLFMVNPDIRLIIPRANLRFVIQRVQQRPDWPICLNDKEKVVHPSGFTIHGIPAAHNELARDTNGDCLFMGYVFEFGDHQVYHSGDTLYREEIVKALKPFDIDLAILPINGNRPERRVAGNLEAKEAVQLAQEIGAKMLIPCHYHMFSFNTVDPENFEKVAREAEQPFLVLRQGEGMRVVW